MKNKILIGLAIFSLSLSSAASAQAQQTEPGVARISLIHGEVSTQRGDSGDWVAGTINAAVVAGDRVSTGTRARVELQLDHANLLRLDERSEVKIADLTRTHIQVQVSKGIVNYTVFKGSEADAEIDTPNAAVRPLGEGRYRIQVSSEQTSEVIVREGEADVSTPQGSTRVRKGQLITIRGSENPEYKITDAPRHDSWDDWNKNRDHQIQDAESWKHANRYFTGVNDLDPYGHWVYVPGYGDCWAPVVPVGWAPYQYGRWVWEPYWGWTWVSYEPWGWAPYHYGRWFLYGGGWNWWPGPVYPAYRPWWAPAFVSFFGFGRHFAVGFGFASIGWVPIGPSDFFFPWWGGFGRTFNVVNVVNVTNIINVRGVRPIAPLATGTRPVFSNLRGLTTNTRLQQSITTMSSEQFGRAAVRRNFQRVTARDLRQAQMVAGIVPVVPTRESLRPVDRAVNPATLPTRANQPERFFTKSTPTRAPEPFHAQAARVRETLQQPQGAMGTGATTAAAPNNPSRSATQTPAAAAPAPSAGWQRFGGQRVAPAEQPATPLARPEGGPQRPQAEPPARNNVQSAPNTSGGWQEFSRQEPRQNPRVATPQASTHETGRGAAAAPSQRPGWQQLTRQPEQQRPSSPEQPRSFNRSPQSESPRGYPGPSPRALSPGYNRPALNLQRPIVTPRYPSGPSGGYRGGQGPSGGGSAGHGTSRPSQGSSSQNHRR
jgi:hypothetical protein